MIIKKSQSLKGKTLIKILFNIGFKKQEKGLRTFYFRNRKKIFKIGICVAKKKIRNSVERNILKRRIRTAYKAFSKNIIFLQKDLIIFFFCKKKIPSLSRLKILMRKIFHTI